MHDFTLCTSPKGTINVENKGLQKKRTCHPTRETHERHLHKDNTRECWLCINASLVGWRVLFFCRPLFSTLMVPFGLVHSVKSCDGIFLFFFFYLFFLIFQFCCYVIVMTLLLGRPCISSQPMGC